MIVDEKDLEFLGKQQRSFLQDQIDGLQYEIADFVLAGDHGDERGTDFVVVGADCFSVREIVHVLDDQSD